jgi:chromosome segregation ATPase
MRSRAVTFLCLTMLAVAPAAAQQAPQRMYKCVDAKGKTYYTQVPPPECLGRETQELNKSGSVVRSTPRGLTPEQRAAHEADEKKRLEAEEKAKEERRKTVALLNTYSSEKEIDDARGRALKEAEAAIAETEKRIVDAQKRQKQLDAEKDFYTKKPMPAKLKQDISNIEIEIKNQKELLEAKKKEIGTINAKYDEDKRRYAEAARKAGRAK